VLQAAVTSVRHFLSLSQFPAAKAGIVVFAISVLALLISGTIDPSAACRGVSTIHTIANGNPLLAYFILFGWSFGLFLTVMPLGTVTIILFGFLLGPAAGLVQFVALILSSMILYELGRGSDEETVNRRLEEYPALSRIGRVAAGHGKWATVILRLVPIVPSAVASLTASFFAISRWDFLIGTLVAGWVRPVAFAALGSLGHYAPVCGLGQI